jgi:dienelactone hydrolase
MQGTVHAVLSHRPVRASVILLVLLASHLPAQATGRVVSVLAQETLSPGEITALLEPLFAGYRVPEVRYAVDVAEVLISTRYPGGETTPVRVQIMVPRRSDSVDSVYLFSPGSTGLIGPCRASREHVAGIVWGRYRSHVLAFAGQGMVGVLPDYMGFEDNALVQPYFHAESEARVIFDALTGTDEWLRERFPRRFPDGIQPYRRVAAGFSQGGHAVLAAADRNATLGRNLPLHGVIGYGATAEVAPMLAMYPSLGPMVFMSYLTVYGPEAIDPRLIFQEPWASDLEYDTTRQCVGGMQSFYPADPYRLYREDFLDSLYGQTLSRTHPRIAALLEENTTGLEDHGVPVLLLQGTDDIVVSRKTQDIFVRRLRAAGAHVYYRVYSGSRHDTRQVALGDVMDWIDSIDLSPQM